MNIDDDYLWDKTGEPDPEIQQLEQVLGTLRYQPRPLDIPAALAPRYKRAFAPRFLAIAATIAMMLVGVGLWLGLQRSPTTAVSTGGKDPQPTASASPKAVAPEKTGDSGAPRKTDVAVAPVQQTEKVNKPLRHRNAGVGSREMARNPRPRVTSPELTPDELKEAQACKEQLMLALRVASSKLNFAQKKVKEINTEPQVHNQHKIG